MIDNIFLIWSSIIGVDTIRSLIAFIFLFFIVFIFIDKWLDY
jgi:hypothetical protein